MEQQLLGQDLAWEFGEANADFVLGKSAASAEVPGQIAAQLAAQFVAEQQAQPGSSA